MDLIFVLDVCGEDNNWFHNCIVGKIGNEASIDFGKIIGLGLNRFAWPSHIMFNNLQQPSLKIIDPGFWFNGV